MLLSGKNKKSLNVENMGKVHRNSLQPGHKLHWYEIKEILGQGGFGITYLAHDVILGETSP